MAKKAKAKRKPLPAKEVKKSETKLQHSCRESDEATGAQSSAKENSFDDEQRGDVLAAFLSWDEDGNGSIDMKEMANVLTSLGLKCSEPEFLKMFQAADCNNDGELDYQEFLDWIFHGAPMAAREHLFGPEFTWHKVTRGKHVVVADDGLNVTRPAGFDETRSMTQTDTWGHATVVGTGLCRKFQFRLIDNEATCEGGFEAGFSKLPPKDLPHPLPATAAELKQAFLSDQNGELVIDGEKAPKASGWEHVFVKNGTVVGVSIEDGNFKVELDDRVVADWQVDVPLEMDLYPLVSLFGTSRSIELIPAEPRDREPYFLEEDFEDLGSPAAPFLSKSSNRYHIGD